MPSFAASSSPQKTQFALVDSSGKQGQSQSLFQFADNRPETALQHRFGEMANGKTVQKKENKTGLPDSLKSGVEELSGYTLNDVKVHYNSSQPAQLQAHAFAQGTDIHLGPGQEKHLPHEAWHVVQQKQGRVKPTVQLNAGVSVNDDTGLEREADVMGGKALLRREKSGNDESATGLHQNGKTGSTAEQMIFQRYGKLAVPEAKEDDPVLSSKQAILDAGDDEYVVVARVITPTQRMPKTSEIKEGLFVSLTKMFKEGLASQADTPRPSDEVVADYVAQKKTDPVKELIEFTTDTAKVGGFAKESNTAYTVYVRIQKKYLTQSESAESGWMANQSAPYEIVKGEKDDVHAGVENERMTAGDLAAALAEELDAEFMLEVQKFGPEQAFAGDNKKREKYIKTMMRYNAQKKKE